MAHSPADDDVRQRLLSWREDAESNDSQVNGYGTASVRGRIIVTDKPLTVIIRSHLMAGMGLESVLGRIILTHLYR